LEFLVRILPKLIAGVLSIMDASRLRDKVYQQQHEHELMWTALDDIARMHPDHSAGKMAKKTLDEVTTRYGR